MKLFSSHSDSSAPQGSASQAIPEEIRKAVSVMGQPFKTTPTMAAEKSASPTLLSVPARQGSPFLTEEKEMPVSAPVMPVSAKPVTPVRPVSPINRPLLSDKLSSSTPKPGGNQKKVLWYGGGSVVLLLALASGYWYFMMRQVTVPSPVSSTPEVSMPAASLSVTPIEPPYALTTPNYLSLDTETITEANFQGLLKETAQRILEARMTTPVEFLLTDKNNNPIAFSRFAYLMKLDLNPEFLTLFDESFSLFVWNDSGKATLGLSLTLKNTPSTNDLFKLQRENTLPFAFRTILYDGVNVPKDLAFRSGLYKNQTVRYVNIDATSTTSFDYALQDKTWLIGTSKDTLRALLDRK